LEERDAELQKTNAKLGRTVEILSEAQQIAHVANWEMDTETGETTWSDEMYKLLGLAPGDIEPTPEAFFKFVHPDDAGVLNWSADDSFKMLSGMNTRFRLLLSDGSIKYVNGFSGITTDTSGNRRAYGIIQDISQTVDYEHKVLELNAVLEERVRQRTAELVDINQQLESFSYSVAHDLRAPLRSIRAFSQIINKEYNDKIPDDCRNLLSVISDNANKMDQLIEDLLAFSKLGKKGIDVSEINTDELVNEIWDNIIRNINRAPRLVKDAVPNLVADKAMITQVLVNFLSNSVKYSEKKPDPVIEIGGYIDNEEVVVFVKDNGAGFDMKYYDKLFGVFQRLHSSTEFDGTGVGLAIVKRIIDKHNGRVWANGKVNEGASFYFALPLITNRNTKPDKNQSTA
jgi:signal transduction histidine kinase